jgi:YgiT-type zinc finger domain-containing protein
VTKIQIISNDGITYQGEINDIIQLSKEQQAKLKFLTLVTNSSKIEKDGIEFGLAERQEKAIMKVMQRIIGKNRISDLTKTVKELIEKRTIIFPSQIQHAHIPDPQRNCIQKRIAITRLIATGKILKSKARFNPESKQIQQRLVYTMESSIDSGKLLISFSRDKFILILNANISEGELMSVPYAELLEMTDNNNFDYSLNGMECPCGGLASPTLTDVSFNFGDKAIVVESVPALICSQCGGMYDDALISIRTEQQAYKAMNENKSAIEF